MKTIAACLLSLILVPACTSSGASDYLLNRGGDLVDIVRFHGIAGKGATAKLEVTRGLHLGIGYEADCWAAGLANREFGTWKETIFTWGAIVGRHDERSIIGIGGRYSGSYGWTFYPGGGSSFQNADPKNALDFLTLRGTLMLGVGVDAELRFGEMIDFVVGIFQFDPSGDDRPYSSLKQLPDEPAATGS